MDDLFMDEVLACAEVTVNLGDLWMVLNQAEEAVHWPPKVWNARMRLYNRINMVRVKKHDEQRNG